MHLKTHKDICILVRTESAVPSCCLSFPLWSSYCCSTACFHFHFLALSMWERERERERRERERERERMREREKRASRERERVGGERERAFNREREDRERERERRHEPDERASRERERERERREVGRVMYGVGVCLLLSWITVRWSLFWPLSGLQLVRD